MKKYTPIPQIVISRAKQLTRAYIMEAMKERGLSNYALAKKAGINRQTIDTYVKNPSYNLTIESYFRICGALELRPYLIPAEVDNNTMNFEHVNWLPRQILNRFIDAESKWPQIDNGHIKGMMSEVPHDQIRVFRFNNYLMHNNHLYLGIYISVGTDTVDLGVFLRFWTVKC